MSFWTYARSQADVFCPKKNKKNLQAIKDKFGKECLWEDGIEKFNDLWAHETDYLPAGSEGTLHLTHKETASGYIIKIGGSLRDVSHTEPIVDWYTEKIKSLNESFKVLSATIRVEADTGEITSWAWPDDWKELGYQND